ncbi:hypothetical protein ALC57_05997 [Trachymyrmex cornetzi]|uniref:Uncharacterized protein n=1 Tax=Trachymyrmex cornetzi TaxID=471704 RepID=A0A151J9C9_9HYME|nr:hypothetical protein ALC57_05997 [Trachymyrmex cornetzi]
MIVTLVNHITQLTVLPDTCFSRSPSSYLFAMRRLSIEWASKSRVPRELCKGSRRACPVPACQLRNRDLTVVMCSVSTIVCRTKWGIQSGCDDGLHDGRTGGQHDAPTARRSYLSQSVSLSRILRTSLIKTEDRQPRMFQEYLQNGMGETMVLATRKA